MTKMKRIGALLLALCMVFALCFVIGCDKGGDDGDNSNSGNGGGNSNSGSGNQITAEDIVSNYESHGYGVEVTDDEDLADIKEVSREEFGIDVNPTCAYMFLGGSGNQAQLYVLASSSEAEALGAALLNMMGGDWTYAVIDNMALLASSEAILAQAYVQGDGTGAGNGGSQGGDIVVAAKYAIIVVDDEGMPIADAFVQYCAKDSTCYTGFTNEAGVIIDEKINDSFYVAMVMADGYETFNGQTFFTEDMPQITIVLSKAE